ncbi:chorismate mutase [Archaeoglobales archaeon]|nr:MAG: chorismate mutase [Archaeoglobales archaeon]
MKILIYGVGGMGGFFKDFFYSRGYYVKGYDVVEKKRDVDFDEIKNFDVVFLCVPMDEMENAVESLTKLKDGSFNPLLIDISSIKDPFLGLLDNSGFDYLSIHPMFGPDSEIGLSNIIVVVESGRSEEKVILNEFKKAGAILSKIDRDKHDKKMAEIQGIAHFMLTSIANFLDVKKQDLMYASPIFSVLFKLASRILNQDWRMYYYIQKNAEKLREQFLDESIKLHELLKDKKRFEEFFKEKSKAYSDFKGSTLILDAFKATEDVDDIDLLRGYIRAVDSLILRLLERRVEAGKRIAKYKQQLNEPIELQDIEEVKLKDLTLKTQLNPLRIQEIFSLIMELTKEEEYKTLGIKKRLAVLPKGSFSEEAALKLVNSRLPLKYCSTTSEIFKAVESGEAEYGLIPIENSINGTVLPVLDDLLSHKVEVFGETTLEINHCLVAKRKLDFKSIKVIYSHPQAIAQCMGFINNYLPHVELRYTYSTSDAIQLLDDLSAAIVSENAARINRLYILKKNIEDLKGRNITRFYLIRKKGDDKKKGNVTCLFFGVEDKPGALKDVLEVFYKKGMNLRKLESRPSGKLGDYIFFAEVEKALSDEDLVELKSVTTFYQIVGVFDEVRSLDVYG